MKIKKKYTRRFLGDASVTASPQEKKHLKAYLKGATRYRHGTEVIKDATGFEKSVPKWHPVKAELREIPPIITPEDEIHSKSI